MFFVKKKHHVFRPRLVQAESRGARLRRLRARTHAAQVHPGVQGWHLDLQLIPGLPGWLINN
jgi:hypothetical protein